MNDKYKRAIRRHHRERLLRKRKRQLSYDLYPPSDKMLRMAIDTPTPCSCEMCGNPRRHFRQRTLQERRVIDDPEDYSED